MSGTRPTPTEQHLGDRLAALVDGELKHDARDRVLAHLATCPRCKAEADAQRRLKSAFATATPPPPSEGFLARLQGLPGGSGGDDATVRGPFDGDGRFGEGLFPVMQPPGGRAGSTAGGSPLDGFGYHPAVHGSTAVLPTGPSRFGFRVHEVGREADRSPWRGRRFAFAAASAVSLAAIALGGALPMGAAPESPLGAEGAGRSTVTPLDADARADLGNAAVSRRGPSGGALATSGDVGDVPVSATRPVPPVTEPDPDPALFATTAPSLLGSVHISGSSFGLPVLNVNLSPLIRPAGSGPLLLAGPGPLLPDRPGYGAEPGRTVPSATASASPPLTDKALPLSPLR